ncbi:hypothetical protein SO802_022048 [Lithocarpus litseifolius]|uniref:BED-type domain-containing protein n=1 Tax=Lithocarpus litseifolius TaxID=425828 RepID=A0AAW2CGT5_9ROSI
MQRPDISATSPSKIQYEVTSAVPTSSKRRRLTSKIWNDFDRVEVDGEHHAICKHCQKNFSGSSKSGTTHLKNHLLRCSAIKSGESCKEMISPSETDGLKLKKKILAVKNVGYNYTGEPLFGMDGLDEIDDILHKTRKAIEYISKTTIGKEKFQEVVKKLNLQSKDITSQASVPIRWDSTFFMLESALEFREAFSYLQSSDCDFPFYGGHTKKYLLIDDALGHIFDEYAKGRSSQASTSYDDNYSDILDRWYKSKRDMNKAHSQRAELHRYWGEPIPDFEGEFDILGWWHTNSTKFPTLWRIAQDILAIPMSTSISNSAFSIETMTINPTFNGLDPVIIEALVCGEDWLDNPARM